MPDTWVHRASDLAAAERRLVEQWLGRAVSDEETVSLSVYKLHPAPVGLGREALRITLDSNILVRAVISPRGPALHLLNVVLDAHTLVSSRFILEDVKRVLLYPRCSIRAPGAMSDRA